ncbi:conserved protein of unknown function [Ectopseudomonas oleovorans]|uniref:Uncharacterized protein n=1 Tax=Ectopseudomonas oleovorans TaxID=301 RepID=A0A653BCQ2_ECTOL|nr:conserved protein of unknown function [Pseudomonas oleovorans]
MYRQAPEKLNSDKPPMGFAAIALALPSALTRLRDIGPFRPRSLHAVRSPDFPRRRRLPAECLRTDHPAVHRPGHHQRGGRVQGPEDQAHDGGHRGRRRPADLQRPGHSRRP